ESRIEEALAGPLLQSFEALLEPLTALAIRVRRDRAQAAGVAQFKQSLPRELGCAAGIASAMFEINSQLLVSLETLARISEHALPQQAGRIEIPLALGEARERISRRAAGFPGQWMGDG